MSARAQDVKTSEEEYMHMYKTAKCITKKEINQFVIKMRKYLMA